MADITAFEKHLLDVLKKHKKIIFAAPSYRRDEAGVWQLDAEIKYQDAIEKPQAEEPKTDLKA